MSEQKPALYPQAQPFGGEELDAFLARPLIAKLCTHNKDGAIHIAPIYFKYEDGTVLLGTQEMTQKVHNIRRDNRVTPERMITYDYRKGFGISQDAGAPGQDIF